MTSDLILYDKIINNVKGSSEKNMNKITTDVKNMKIGGSKIPKEIDIGLEGIEGTDDIDSWGGKKKRTTRKKSTKKKTEKRRRRDKEEQPRKKLRCFEMFRF